MKPQKVWVLCGPKGQLAPFYVYAFTKKGLLAHITQMGFPCDLKDWYRPVRVTVTVTGAP
jgi:hypothetical protein